MRSMRMNNPACPLRSLDGFRKFLLYVYERKYIGGKMLSVESYMGNLSMFMGKCHLPEHVLNCLDRAGITQEKAWFNDYDSKGMNKKSVDNLNSTMEAYIQYIRYTGGFYGSKMVAKINSPEAELRGII